jgi:quinol monooxygenase YgiN
MPHEAISRGSIVLFTSTLTSFFRQYDFLARIVKSFLGNHEGKLPMIGLELAVKSYAAHRTELLQTLQNLTVEAVGHDGCLECRVFEDVNGSGRFLWSQWWRSQSQLEAHLGSVAFRTLLGAIKVLGTLESARTLDLQDATSVMGALLTDRVNMTDQPSEI